MDQAERDAENRESTFLAVVNSPVFIGIMVCVAWLVLCLIVGLIIWKRRSSKNAVKKAAMPFIRISDGSSAR